ncbi:hypothetical protein C0993_000396 [Termitomyces sp. T159_Od127]|nr:hypothetical protein C0993_000396 [Termitomyces sp. T159_Od127]
MNIINQIHDHAHEDIMQLCDSAHEDLMQIGYLKKELSTATNARNHSLAKMAAHGYLKSLADTATQSSASKPSMCAVKVTSLHSNSNALAHLYHRSILPPNINTLMLNLKTLYPTIKQEFGKTLYAKLSDAIRAYTDIDYDTLVVPHDLKEEETALLLSLGQLAPKPNLLILEPDGKPVTLQTISHSASLQSLAKPYNLKG